MEINQLTEKGIVIFPIMLWYVRLGIEKLFYRRNLERELNFWGVGDSTKKQPVILRITQYFIEHYNIKFP